MMQAHTVCFTLISQGTLYVIFITYHLVLYSRHLALRLGAYTPYSMRWYVINITYKVPVGRSDYTSTMPECVVWLIYALMCGSIMIYITI